MTAERDLRYTRAMVTCSATIVNSPTTTSKSYSNGCGLVPRAIAAARTLQPLWSA